MKYINVVTRTITLILVFFIFLYATISVRSVYSLTQQDIESIDRGVQRIDGQTRIQVSSSFAIENWPNGAETVFVIGGEDAASALPAVAWAYQLDAPMLIPQLGGNPDGTHPDFLNTLEKLNPNQVYIIGGEGSVGSQAKETIKNTLNNDSQVERVFGSTRVTGASLFNEHTREEIGDSQYFQNAILINGWYGLADGFSVVAQAAQNGIPIFYTNGNGNLINDVGSKLEQFNHVYIIGGTNQISSNTENSISTSTTRLAGENAIDTNLEILNHPSFRTSNDRLYVATHDVFSDATIAAIVAAKQGAGIILVDDAFSQEQLNFMNQRFYYRFDILGGTDSVPQVVENQLNDFFRAPTVSASHSISNDQSKAELSIIASDSQSGIYRMRYRNPNGTWSSWTPGDGSWFSSPQRSRIKAREVTNNGTYIIEVEDRMGHVETLSHTISGIDTIPPIASAQVSPTGWTNESVTISVSAFDEQSGVRRVRMRRKSESWGEWSSFNQSGESYFSVSINGEYEFQIEDNAGNSTIVNRTIDNIDRSAPKGRVTQSSTSWTNENVTLTTLVNDSGMDDRISGVKRIRMRKNGSSWSSWETFGSPSEGSSTTYSRTWIATENGRYEWELEDRAGNRTIFTHDVVNIDKSKPSGSINHYPESWTNDNVTIYVSNSDDDSGVRRIRIKKPNLDYFEDWRTSISDEEEFTGSINGKYEFDIEDNAGNRRFITYTIENIDIQKPIIRTFIEN